MKGNLVITIGRQAGSGGKKIGELLAKELGIKFYDKELLAAATKNSGICQELFESHDERPTNSFLYSLVMDTYSLGYTTSSYLDMPINHKIFLAQFDAIKQIADNESCVIIGRCADYALAEHDNLVTVFVNADEEDRIKRIAEVQNITEDKAKDLMIKIDKKRSSYYNYYSNKHWSDSKSYDLCINSSRLGFEGCVNLLRSYINIKKESDK